jgi:hypothetical protein
MKLALEYRRIESSLIWTMKAEDLDERPGEPGRR